MTNIIVSKEHKASLELGKVAVSSARQLVNKERQPVNYDFTLLGNYLHSVGVLDTGNRDVYGLAKMIMKIENKKTG